MPRACPAACQPGKIGGLVLASLMPARRLRASPRVVKRATSRHDARGKAGRATRKPALAITILAPGDPATSLN